MQFDYTPRPTRHPAAEEAATFNIERLWARQTNGRKLAERFGLPVRSVRLSLH